MEIFEGKNLYLKWISLLFVFKESFFASIPFHYMIKFKEHTNFFSKHMILGYSIFCKLVLYSFVKLSILFSKKVVLCLLTGLIVTVFRLKIVVFSTITTVVLHNFLVPSYKFGTKVVNWCR